MSLHYNIVLNPDFSYSFITDNGDIYDVYFIEYPLIDADDNKHIIYYFSFVRNGNFECKNFQKKYDPKIKLTFVEIAVRLFDKMEHACVTYDCFNEDGFARHRSIVFKNWCKELPAQVECHHTSVVHRGIEWYSTLILSGENPLKRLILDAYTKNLRDIANNW
ncbi:MAG TPA: hypothetical protein VFE53_22810 [Mucilaginibacter sp.]|nr:hypothetical protein [Mucilaginibacter sp.]